MIPLEEKPNQTPNTQLSGEDVEDRENTGSNSLRSKFSRPDTGICGSTSVRFARIGRNSASNPYLYAPPHKLTSETQRINETMRQYERPEIALIEQEKCAENQSDCSGVH